VLDGGGQLLAQLQGSGGGTTRYTLPDGQGSVRALVTSSGLVIDTYRYDGQRLPDRSGEWLAGAQRGDYGESE